MMRLIVVVAVTAALAAGCSTQATMDTPTGFAAYTDGTDYLAVSPEGVTIRARAIANKPEQSEEFWLATVRRQLTEAGYWLVKEADEDDLPVWLEWSAPLNDAEWRYLTAVTVDGATILVVEAAGPTADYDLRREAILSGLTTLRRR